jgi:hypothetical protein
MAEDIIEAIALHGLTTFCGFHPLELSTHPIGLFPAEKEDDPMWKDRVKHAKDIVTPQVLLRVSIPGLPPFTHYHMKTDLGKVYQTLNSRS